MPSCNLMAVGNELLSGDIRDRNLYTLSQALTRLGFTVTQAVVVRDDPEKIQNATHYLLDPTPDLLIYTGGLGPTQDDLTLAAVANALDRPLALNEDARRLVKAHYARLLAQGYLKRRGPESARAKMAQLPEGAKPLLNPVGTAPGVELQHGKTRIYILPGVPAEMEAIFSQTIVPTLKDQFALGVWAQAGLRVHCDDEAEVAEPLEEVRERHPTVYVKSLAQPFPAAGDEGLRVVAETHASSAEEAKRAVKSALDDLRDVMEAAGVRVSTEEI